MKSLFAVLAALLMAFMVAVPALAAGEVNFVVTPVLPDNQREGVRGYFDLIVQPGQTQELYIDVANNAGVDMVVELEALTASTNANGVINLTTQGETHESLTYSLADLVTIEEPAVEVPAHTAIRIPVTVEMPEDPYDGYLLGSIHVKRRLSESELASGQTILNQYSYVIALKLAESLDVVERDFSLGDVQASLVNGRASIVNNIINAQPTMVKEMTTTVSILPKGSDTPVMERTMEETDMAPNSIFPFTLTDEAGYGIKAGTYLSVVEIAYKEQNWHFEKEFEIKAEEAAAINSNAVNLTEQAAMDTGLPLWLVVMIIIGVALLLAVIVLLVLLLRKKGAVA